MHIRAYQTADAPQLGQVFKASVCALGPLDYSAAQVKAWAQRAPSAQRAAALNKDGRTTLIAVDADENVKAFIDLERSGHIDFLCAMPDVAGGGIVAQLYEALEQVARDWQLRRLFTEASEGAKRFFLKQGFQVVQRRNFKIASIAIHNYEMEKSLI
ncbi:MAG: GNAT family N-acetyltransferase [Pseudomonadota bacterium]